MMYMRTVDMFALLIARLRRQRRVVLRPVDGLVKVNLGCGLTIADGWVNVDVGLNALVARWPRAVLRLVHRRSGFRELLTAAEFADVLRSHDFCHHDLAHGLPFPDDSTDYIYSSHFLEHLYTEHAPHFISEIHRVLKPGGTVRICVPDLEIAFDWYRQGEKRKALRQFYQPVAWGHFAQHRYLYDFDMLQGLLERAGFVQIVRCSCCEGTTPDLDTLDVRPEETLYVEARKSI
jgi:SAM-dependent methyltransferase